jgi:hypothetical protein
MCSNCQGIMILKKIIESSFQTFKSLSYLDVCDNTRQDLINPWVDAPTNVYLLVFKCECLGQYFPYGIIMNSLTTYFNGLGMGEVYQLRHLKKHFEAWASHSFENNSLLNLCANEY